MVVFKFNLIFADVIVHTHTHISVSWSHVFNTHRYENAKFILVHTYIRTYLYGTRDNLVICFSAMWSIFVYKTIFIIASVKYVRNIK